MTRAFIAIGSNLACPVEQVRAALKKLDKLDKSHLIAHSSLYQTTPIGYVDQPDFINAVAELETKLTPVELLDALLALESAVGRVRTFRNAPRVLDLDLLWYQGVTVASERLVLPHPAMTKRAFVMIPLAEIAPELELGDMATAAIIAQRLAGDGIIRLSA